MVLPLVIDFIKTLIVKFALQISQVSIGPVAFVLNLKSSFHVTGVKP